MARRVKNITENELSLLADGILPQGIEEGATIITCNGIGILNIEVQEGKMIKAARIVEIPIGQEGDVEFQEDEIIEYPQFVKLDDKAWKDIKKKKKRKK